METGISELGYIYVTANHREGQDIIEILTQFIIDHAPPLPELAYSFVYCLQQPGPPAYPPYLNQALRIIGERNPDDLGQSVNLSGLNFAYATLDGNFENVNFDDDLLCRAISYGSDFEGASFAGADLRFFDVMNSDGLSAQQLQSAYSLYKAQIPQAIASNGTIEYLLRTDPQLTVGN
jgi:hypothetical protein